MSRTTNNDVAVVKNAALEGMNYRTDNVEDFIKNDRFVKHLKTYKAAETTTCNQQWKAADSLYVMKEMATVEDFNSESEFAAFMGMTQTYVNKVCRAVDFSKTFREFGLTVSKSFELLSLKEEDVIKDCLETCGIDEGWTSKDIRNAVKTYKVALTDGGALNKDTANDTESNSESPEATSEYAGVKGTDEVLDLEVSMPVYVNKEVIQKKINIPEDKIDSLGKYIAKWLKQNDIEF